MRREIPAPWLKLMEQRGYSSVRRLAEAAGISHTAVSRVLHGEGNPSDESVIAIAGALDVVPSKAFQMLGVAVREDAQPYEPPPEAARLTRRQRKAVDEVIRLLVAAEDSAGAGNVRQLRPNSPGDSSDDLPASWPELAADSSRNRDRETAERHSKIGEESQDPGWDES